MGLFGQQETQSQVLSDTTVAALYVNDVILGMLETGRLDLQLAPEQRMPFFGFILGRPMAVDFSKIVARLKAMTETMEPGTSNLETSGSFMVVLGPQEDGFGFCITVTVGPEDQWLRLQIGANQVAA